MAVSKAQQRATAKYIKANYDRMEIVVPKGTRETIKAHATANGESVGAFIKRAVDCQMERDDGGIPPKIAQQAAEGPPGGGAVSIPAETMEAAQRAAEATGEALPDFVSRAVAMQAQRDKSSLRLGINPATGEKLKKED